MIGYRIVFSIGFLMSFSFLLAQTVDRLEIPQGSLIEAIDMISERSDRTIFHNVPDTIILTRPFDFVDQRIEEILEELLEETIYGYVAYRDYAIVILSKSVLDIVYSPDNYSLLRGDVSEKENGSTTLVIGKIELLQADGRTTISGRVTDFQSKEPLGGAVIRVGETGVGTTSDLDGNYELTLRAGEYSLIVDFVGYDKLYQTIELKSNGTLDFELSQGAMELQEVTIKGKASDAQVTNAQVVTSISVEALKKLPTFLGEVDVIKGFLLQPGVSSIGEGSVGFNVRGGEVDQNLILQDETILFNSSHALGFFSTFNADLIKGADLYKANIPPSYGGRLASVLDVEMRDGNFKRFKVKGGIGPLSSKLSLEGPLVKEKVSFIAGGRVSYSDWILKSTSVPELQNSSSFFYDANFRLTIKPNQSNTITLSGYKSIDEFRYNDVIGFKYETESIEFDYAFIVNQNLSSKLSVVGSGYKSAQQDLEGLDAGEWSTGIDYIKVKENVTYSASENLEINAGINVIQYKVAPGAIRPIGDVSLIETTILEQEKGREASIYANVKIAPNDAIEILAGLRYVKFDFLGPSHQYIYLNPERPETDEITGSLVNNGVIHGEGNLEPRASLRVSINDASSFKAGFSRTSQFINQIFNTSTPTPTSQWQLSNQYIPSFSSDSYSAGYFLNLAEDNWETYVEVYYRDIKRLFDFKDFADLLVNDHIETELLNGIGRAKGVELSIRKKKGTTNGWLSYTYSLGERQIDGINEGDWYPSSFDKTHDVSLLFNYNPNLRTTWTCNFNYSTGRPISVPVGNYRGINGRSVSVFSHRNELRIPDYMRLDLALTFGQGYKKESKFKTSWTISIYNVLGRKNPYSVYFRTLGNDLLESYKFSVLGSAFPSVTVNFELQ